MWYSVIAQLLIVLSSCYYPAAYESDSFLECCASRMTDPINIVEADNGFYSYTLQNIASLKIKGNDISTFYVSV